MFWFCLLIIIAFSDPLVRGQRGRGRNAISGRRCSPPFRNGPGSNGTTSRCYFFSDPKTPAKTWNEAQEGCTRIGSTLAPVETKAQQDFIVAGYDANTVIGLFIGGRSTPSCPKNFYWLLTYTEVGADGFTFWGRGEPNFDFEHCMQMDNTRGKYKKPWEWNNVNCGDSTAHTPYVCAYDL